MSEMIERVARAMATANGVRSGRVDREWPLYAGQARAGIEVMRNPSEKAIERAYEANGRWGELESLAADFNSVIDAILVEETP